MVEAELPQQARTWLSNWRARGDVRPWMLLNLAAVLFDADRRAEAVEVCLRAIELPPDHATPLHYLWLAADAVLSRRSADARGYLANVEERRLDAFYNSLRHLVYAMLRLDSEPGGEAQYREALAEVKTAFKVMERLRRQPALARYANRTLWRIACARAKPGGVPIVRWLWLRMTMA